LIARGLTVVALTWSCGYDASFRNCTIACTTTTGCPTGFACGSDGFCKSDGATAECTSSTDPGDATNATTDVSVSGPQILSETTSNVVTTNVGCGNGDGTEATSYYRAFPLTMFGITGAFEVSSVGFVIEQASGSPMLRISVGTYSGTPGTTTLVGSQITLINTTMTTDGSGSQGVPLAAEVPAGGDVLVEIDQLNSGSGSDAPSFYIGANSDGETEPGYMSAQACSITVPTSVTQELGTETDILITVTGSAQ
jgi:hypothetical protein